jgi:hypothetical protein
VPQQLIGNGEGARTPTRNSPTVVIDHILSQLLTKLAQNNILVEEFTLIAMLEVLSDALPHISRQFPIRHVLLHLLHLRMAELINDDDGIIQRLVDVIALAPNDVKVNVTLSRYCRRLESKL